MQMIRGLIVLVLALSAFSGAMAQQKRAVLIANQDYLPGVGALFNPVNDIDLVEQSLTDVGFEISARVVDGDRTDILLAVNQLADELANDGDNAIGFVYYSGHGLAIEGDNYLVPVDIDRPTNALMRIKGVKLEDIMSTLQTVAPNAASYLIFDACRTNLGGSRGAKGFAPVRKQRGTLIAFAAEPGETASDFGDTSGPYAAALAAEMTVPGQTDLEMFHNVRVRVLDTTDGVQVPWTSDGIQLAQRPFFGGQQIAVAAAEITATKARLKDLGYAPGALNSELNLDLRIALAAFQKERGLLDNGILSPELVALIGAVHSGQTESRSPQAETTLLSDGFSLPNADSTSTADLIVPERILEDGPNYTVINDQPWERKTLLESDTSDYFRPRAKIVAGVPYLLYLERLNKGSFAPQPLRLMELNLKTGDVFEAGSDLQEGGWYFNSALNMQIIGDFIYYFVDNDPARPGRKYRIGSGEPASVEDYYGERDDWLVSRPSPNNRYVAIANGGDGLHPSVLERVSQDYRLAYGEADGGGEFTGISIYDRKNASQRVLFKQEYTGDWSIGDIIWSDDNERIYFDNSGAVACIWEYDLRRGVLTKIVPEHEAGAPFYFRFEGQDYILYTERYDGGVSKLMVTRH